LTEQAFIDVVIFLQNRSGGIGRGIINHNHLDTRVCLIQGAVNGLPQILLVVVTGNYYADEHVALQRFLPARVPYNFAGELAYHSSILYLGQYQSTDNSI
jgi:hypothetical protein